MHDIYLTENMFLFSSNRCQLHTNDTVYQHRRMMKKTSNKLVQHRISNKTPRNNHLIQYIKDAYT